MIYFFLPCSYYSPPFRGRQEGVYNLKRPHLNPPLRGEEKFGGVPLRGEEDFSSLAA
jgi:hypothetical protein